jgi:hypothetical protein
VLGFQALANLDYNLEFRSDLAAGSWLFSQEFGSSPVDRFLSSTSSVSASPSRFFHLWVRP